MVYIFIFLKKEYKILYIVLKMSVEEQKYVLLMCKNYTFVTHSSLYDWMPIAYFQDRELGIEYFQSNQINLHFEELKTSMLKKLYDSLVQFRNEIKNVSKEDLMYTYFLFDEMTQIKNWNMRKYEMDEIHSMFVENPYELLKKKIYFQFVKM
jgi:hypothetical protein